MLAEEIMTETVISVTPDHSVRHAAQIMLDHHVSGLPVIDDDGKLVGLLTEGDLLRRTELGPSAEAESAHMSEDYIKAHSWRVGDVMTRNAVTVDETLPIGRVAAVMSVNDIKRVPVMRGDIVAGIVSRSDILRIIATAEPQFGAPGAGDDAIRRAVATRLHADLGLDPARVGVTVHNGNVHLWGRVNSDADRTAAQIAAETVHEIGCIVNDLRVEEALPLDPATGIAR